MGNPGIGVVTVTYNSAGVLPDFLRCMLTQTYANFILFAIDNASRDNTLELLAACPDSRLRVIANADNLGVAEGNNQGIRAAIEAGCELVLLINNDTEFDDTLVAKLVDGIDQYQADMICPKMMYFDEPNRIWAAGGRFRPWLGYRTEHIGENEVDHGQYDSERLVHYVPTCCVLIRKRVFDKIGLMDERYFVYVDDVDFMFRAMKAGVKLQYIPDARLLHKVGRLTGGGESDFSVRYGVRNRHFFMLKHFGPIRALPWILAYEFYYCVRMLSGKDNLSRFNLRQSAFQEGIAIWRDAFDSSRRPSSPS